MNKHTKILAVCQAGESRSVAFAYVLKHDRGYDNVLNCGIDKVMPDTFAMLAKWADVIYVTADPTVWRRIPHTFRAKATLVNVGFDVWRDPSNSQLLQIMRKEVAKLGL